MQGYNPLATTQIEPNGNSPDMVEAPAKEPPNQEQGANNYHNTLIIKGFLSFLYYTPAA